MNNDFARIILVKMIQSKDRKNYKVVLYGYFAYNAFQINVGSVDWQHCEDTIIVSPLYVVYNMFQKDRSRFV